MTTTQILTLLGMLAAVNHVAEGECSDAGNATVCTVARGGSAYVQVMPDASGHQVWCKKILPRGPANVFSLKSGKLTIHAGVMTNRTGFFVHNGTFVISHAEPGDSGQYVLEAFDADGLRARDFRFHLDVKESSSILLPVSVGVGAALLLILLLLVCCCVRKRKSGRKASSV